MWRLPLQGLCVYAQPFCHVRRGNFPSFLRPPLEEGEELVAVPKRSHFPLEFVRFLQYEFRSINRVNENGPRLRNFDDLGHAPIAVSPIHCLRSRPLSPRMSKLSRFVNGNRRRLQAVNPKLGFREVDIVAPHHAIAIRVCLDAAEEGIILQRGENFFCEKRRAIIDFACTVSEGYVQALSRERFDRRNSRVYRLCIHITQAPATFCIVAPSTFPATRPDTCPPSRGRAAARGTANPPQSFQGSLRQIRRCIRRRRHGNAASCSRKYILTTIP